MALHRAIHVVLVQQDGNPDFGGVDHLDVDAGLVKRFKHPGGHAAVGHQPGAYNGHLADMAVRFDMVKPQDAFVLLQNLLGFLQILFMDGKGNVLGVLPANGLKDDVHVDIVLAQQVKHLKRDAGIMLQAR